ncbi:MAG TPA: hypothetical protein DCE41_02580 [Cytophagales bacterium]|nr:hypothetical protein [Cytophagales bacterium]HAA17916.1 hypothetical protein [Cytophagales bacterium]HAP65279.1 hypothetical protein [Cytophagales bacterium]
MKKTVLGLALLITCSTTLWAQDIHKQPSKRDFRMGTGLSLLGTGDLYALQVESEVNYKWLPHLAVSGSGTVGASPFNPEDNATFLQFNGNAFLSPFRNDRLIDFRVGGGLSYYFIKDLQPNYFSFDESDVLIRFDENSVLRHALGFNIIVETTFQLRDGFLLGTKAFTQPYLNGDINTGVMAKVGVQF